MGGFLDLGVTMAIKIKLKGGMRPIVLPRSGIDPTTPSAPIYRTT